MKNIAIILASGNGDRMGIDIPKQFAKIAGKTVIEHTLEIFERNFEIDEIVVVTKKEYVEKCEKIVIDNGYKKISKILVGGKTRQESCSCAVMILDAQDEDNVLIHDGVRPFLSDIIIKNCIEALKKHRAVVVAVASTDTLVKVDSDLIIEKIPNRTYLMRGQTPQAFKYDLIKKAHTLANNDKEQNNFTDDCGLIKHYNLSDIFAVNGDECNIKITKPIDLHIADKLFQLTTYGPKYDSLEALNDKVIVIFGASNAIDKTIAQMAKDNMATVYAYFKKDGLDVSNNIDISQILEEIYKKEGKIDFIINTARASKADMLESRDIFDIEDEIKINYFGAINVLKSSIKYLKESKGSLLLYVSNSCAKDSAMCPIYSSTKAALINLTQAASEEYYQDGIRINIISPQRTATPMILENFGHEDQEPLLTPEVVAKSSLSTLLSNHTGQVINVTL